MFLYEVLSTSVTDIDAPPSECVNKSIAHLRSRFHNQNISAEEKLNRLEKANKDYECKQKYTLTRTKTTVEKDLERF